MGQSAALYARASTADQSCQRQIADLTAFANRCGYEVAGTFAETVSGAASRRPERDRIMRLARQRRIDAVLVTEVSRWGRSTQDLLATLHQLAGWNVSAVARNGLALELDTPHGRMMATVLAGIAQFEREPISERVKSGLAAARERGVKLGRQPGQRPKADRLAPKVLRAVDGGRSYRWIARPRHRQEYRACDRQARPRITVPGESQFPGGLVDGGFRFRAGREKPQRSGSPPEKVRNVFAQAPCDRYGDPAFTEAMDRAVRAARKDHRDSLGSQAVDR